MSELVAATVVAGNYLAFARVLQRSLQRFHPEIPFKVLLADTERSCRTAEAAGLHIIRMRELGTPGLRSMLMRYDRRQILSALKPSLLRHLLEAGNACVLYLDADFLVTASLQPVLDAVARHALSVTPHLCSVPALNPDGIVERHLLLSGVYNAGVIGVTNRPEALQFTRWWERRVRTHCLEALHEGLHYDQRWLDLAPGYVSDFHVIRDPGFNVAYWNLGRATVAVENGTPCIDGDPLRLFHFSGFDRAHPHQVTRHVPGLTVSEVGSTSELFRRYAGLLDEAGWAQSIQTPWPWVEPSRTLRRIRWLRDRGLDLLTSAGIIRVD